MDRPPEGVETLYDIIHLNTDVGIGSLTLYAFSTENGTRPSKRSGR